MPSHTTAPKDDQSAIDWDDLKERMSEAIRAVIQECADELGLGWETTWTASRTTSNAMKKATVPRPEFTHS
jgi:hypothetical protein